MENNVNYRIIACNARLEGIIVEVALLTNAADDLPIWRFMLKRKLEKRIMEKLEESIEIRCKIRALRRYNENKQ